MLVQGQDPGAFATTVPTTGRPADLEEAARARQCLVGNLAARLDVLAREMAGAYVALAGHGGRQGSLSGFEPAEAATEQLLYLLRAAATGEATEAECADELSALAGLAAELARAGVRLGDMLDVCNASFLVAWEAVQDELVRLPAPAGDLIGPDVRTVLLAAMTRSTVVVSEAFHHERLARADSEPESVLRSALNGSMGEGEGVRRSQDAGWPVDVPHTLVVVRCERVDAHKPKMTGIHQVLQEALEGVRVQGRALLTCVHGGALVVAVPEAGADWTPHAEQWRHVIAALSAPPGYRLLVGAGLSVGGFAGVPAGYGQARRALAVAATRGGGRVVVSYGDVLPELLLLDSPALAHSLYRLAVQPLEEDRADAGELLASLEVYLDLGLNAMAAAAALGVHRHTLATRLQQVEQRTGLRIDDGDQRLLLELGLRARRVVDGQGGQGTRVMAVAPGRGASDGWAPVS